jgi:hypothetical protein
VFRTHQGLDVSFESGFKVGSDDRGFRFLGHWLAVADGGGAIPA